MPSPRRLPAHLPCRGSSAESSALLGALQRSRHPHLVSCGEQKRQRGRTQLGPGAASGLSVTFGLAVHVALVPAKVGAQKRAAFGSALKGPKRLGTRTTLCSSKRMAPFSVPHLSWLRVPDTKVCTHPSAPCPCLGGLPPATSWVRGAFVLIHSLLPCDAEAAATSGSSLPLPPPLTS